MNKTHNEFIEEVKELTKPKTLAERTHNALSDNSHLSDTQERNSVDNVPSKDKIDDNTHSVFSEENKQ